MIIRDFFVTSAQKSVVTPLNETVQMSGHNI